MLIVSNIVKNVFVWHATSDLWRKRVTKFESKYLLTSAWKRSWVFLLFFVCLFCCVLCLLFFTLRTYILTNLYSAKNRDAMCQSKSCQLLHKCKILLYGPDQTRQSPRTCRIPARTHTLTVGEFVDHTNKLATCCSEISKSKIQK